MHTMCRLPLDSKANIRVGGWDQGIYEASTPHPRDWLVVSDA